MLFSIAKKNLLAGFKSKFILDKYAYLYYPKEYDNPFECSKEQYLNYTTDFKKVLKYATRILWLWLLCIIPIMLWIEFNYHFEFNIFNASILFLLPFPYLGVKVSKVYNAPNELINQSAMQGKQLNAQEIKNTRIKGMSWLLLIMGNLMPIIAIYIIHIEKTLTAQQKNNYTVMCVTILLFFVYLLYKKFTLEK